MSIVEYAPLVRNLWRALPYQAFGACATCGASHTESGTPLFLAGRNIDSRVCIVCFEFEHDCKAPNYRRRRLH